MIMRSTVLRIQILLFTFLFLSAPALGQTSDQSLASVAQIEAYVQQGMQQLDIPGAAIALFQNGKITHLKGFGTKDSSGSTVTAQTPFQIGSISKSFAALVVLQLVDEGRLSLDDPVSKHIPYFQTSDKTASDQISVRHLLNHRSGLSTLEGNRYQDTTYRGADAMERVIRDFKHVQLFAKPGARFQYSNANYMLIAQLIETVEKISYETTVQNRIFAKLGMKNSYIQMATDSAETPALGHTQWFGFTVEKNFIAGRLMMGAGGVTSSAEDLATYLVAIFENDPRIMSSTLAKALAKERQGGYEFGWEFDTVAGQRIIFHGGLNPGFLAMVKYKPKSRDGVLILTNMNGSHEGRFIYGLTDYALGLPSTDIAPANIALLRFWGTLSLMCLLAVGFVYSVVKLIKPPSKSYPSSLVKRWLRISVPSLFLVGLSYFLAFVVPQLSGVNLTAIGMFYPDLYLLMAISSVIALMWALVRTLLLVRR
nr:serine hydrolase domain-containing protein [uncultured Undibacterium sp.]